MLILKTFANVTLQYNCFKNKFSLKEFFSDLKVIYFKFINMKLIILDLCRIFIIHFKFNRLNNW